MIKWNSLDQTKNERAIFTRWIASRAFIGHRVNLGFTAGQSYNGFDQKRANFHDLTYFPTWTKGKFLDTGCWSLIR